IGELDLNAYTPAPVTTTVTGADGLPLDEVAVATALAASETHDVFDVLSNAFHRTVAITVPRGRAIAEPIVVTHHINGDGVALFPRLVVHAGEDSEVTVVERFESSTGAKALVVPRLFLHAAQAARVSYLALNLLDTTVWQLGHQQASGERDSTTLLATVA